MAKPCFQERTNFKLAANLPCGGLKTNEEQEQEGTSSFPKVMKSNSEIQTPKSTYLFTSTELVNAYDTNSRRMFEAGEDAFHRI